MGVLFVFGGGVGLDAVVDEELLDLFFSAAGSRVRDAAEVFDGVEAGGRRGDGDADGGELRRENVVAVMGTIHPGLVDGGCGGNGAGYVFGDGAEVRSRLRGAGDEIGLSGVLVLGGTALPGHDGDVGASGTGESRVPGERREIVLGAGMVGEDEEELLVGGLGVAEGREEGKEKREVESAAHVFGLDADCGRRR